MRNGLISLAGRFLMARKLRTAMGVLSVALGVGLLVALLTLNATMDRALDQQITRQFGTYELMAGYRKPGLRFSAEDLAQIEQMPGVQEVAGILIPFYLEGMPLSRGLNYYGVPDTPLGRQFMTVAQGAWPGPGEVAVAEAWAKREGLAVGDSTELEFGPGNRLAVRVSGLLPVDKRMAIGIGLFDRTWLQEVTGRPGATFALIDTRDGTPVYSVINGIQDRFQDAEVDQRKFLDELRKNMNALRPVGLGMGLAALLASAFLLTGAFRMSLAERTRELATLRAIAATPGQIRRLILAEGLFLGLLGAGAGVLLGALGAAGSSGAVARLLAVEAYTTVFPWGGMLLAAVGGLLLALFSALGVARSASRTEPLRAMRPDLPAQEESARTGGRFGLVLAGLGAVGVALGLSGWLPDEAPLDFLPPLVGSTGGLAVAVGLLLGVQRLLPLLLPVLSAPVRGTSEGTVAVRSLLRHRRRSGLTVGAMGLGMILVVAIATIGWSLVGRWTEDIRRQHPADLQLEVPGLVYQGVSSDLAERVGEIPGVTAVATVGEYHSAFLVDWDFSKADPEWLAAMEKFNQSYGVPGIHQRQSLSPTPVTLPELVAMGAYDVVAGTVEGFGEGQIAIEADYAETRGIRLGDRLKLNVSQEIPRKALANPVIREYTVVALLKADTWRMPKAVVSAGAPLPGGTDRLRIVYANAAPDQLAAAREQARDLVGGMEFSSAVYSDQESALTQFELELNQRLALLVAVALVMAAVAVMSLIGAMVSSVSERRREFAMLRSVGATPQQVRNMVLIEGGLLGLVGALVGIAGGAVLGTAALTGLELPLAEVHLPWPVMGAGLVLGLVLALLAALGPARKVMAAAPADAVRYE